MKTPSDLFQFLDSLGIAHQTIEHPAVFTAEETIDWKGVAPGLHCKNLFVENKAGKKFLITMPALERANMGFIARQLGFGRFSFVKSEHMLPVLGVPAGHATPFALLNESARDVQIILDEMIPNTDAINIHPLTNTASTIVSGKDLLKFLQTLGHKVLLAKTYDRNDLV